MKTFYRVAFVVSLILMSLALVGIVFSRYWVDVPLDRARASSKANSGLVDEQPLLTAEALAPLAATREEQDFAQEALRVADHEVDLTFASALRSATLHPAPLSPAARAIAARIQELQSQIKLQQADINRLKAKMAQAKDDQKESIDEDLQLQQALLEVAQEELDGAQQELIRAGGDQRSVVQRLQDQHEAWHQRQAGTASTGATAAGTNAGIEETTSRSLVAQARAWLQLNSKTQQLERARDELKIREAELSRQRQDLEKNPGASAPSAAQNESGASPVFSTLKAVAEQQRALSELDKRTQDLQALDALYTNWAALVNTRQRAFAVGFVQAIFWIFVILTLVLLANPILRVILSRGGAESQRLHTARVAARFAIQAIGIALVLLVIFGPPNQLATVVALAGAGLTVALKDFIVGFVGWFALMGPNGIRAGDWVEIEGVGGEVLEVGPLHTILLETGGWSDAGHPTGRKVTFVNSFAIEGHYFNFSTSGQWLWDEIQVPIPAGVDAPRVIETIQKIVAKETEANARLAEKEWQRVVLARGGRAFSAAPAITVQPSSAGVTLIARYITRAPEWRDVRAHLYGEIVELLRKEQNLAATLDKRDPPSLVAVSQTK